LGECLALFWVRQGYFKYEPLALQGVHTFLY
jgi:hypothetical protein